MATTYCRRCGVNLTQGDRFCVRCGHPVYAPSTTTQNIPAPHTQSSHLSASFFLGFVGAMFGLVIGAFLILFSSLGFLSHTAEAWARAVGVIVFSIIGIIGPLRIIERGDTYNALLMILAGVMVLVCVAQLGVIPALLFFIGGALLYLKKG
ncbi:MAG: zinc-ribbon domain-containing protein [Halobacteriota archaeon]